MSDTISDMKFGLKIKQARKEAGLTQEQLGIRCGWAEGNPQSRIGNYEKDTRSPSAADIAVIADALSKDILYFYNREESASGVKETPASYQTQTTLSSAQIDLLEQVIITTERKFKDIDAKTKASLIATMFAEYNKANMTADMLKTESAPTDTKKTN